MREINHSGVLKLYEIYESDQYINLIMENNKSVGLLTKVKSKNKYTEGDVAKMMKSLINFVNVLQNLRIIHRDLNPEILIVS